MTIGKPWRKGLFAVRFRHNIYVNDNAQKMIELFCATKFKNKSEFVGAAITFYSQSLIGIGALQFQRTQLEDSILMLEHKYEQMERKYSNNAFYYDLVQKKYELLESFVADQREAPDELLEKLMVLMSFNKLIEYVDKEKKDEN